MIDGFDVVKLESGDYDLISGHSVVKIEFSDDGERNIFESLLKLRDKPPISVIKSLSRNYGKERVYSFFLKFKDASIVFFDTESDLFKEGYFSSDRINKYKLKEGQSHSIGIISASSFSAVLREFDIFSDAITVDARTLTDLASVEEVFGHHDLVVVDASAFNPTLLDNINCIGVSTGKPWLLVQGVYEQVGHVGPLFFGSETGCFHCFRDRMRSNMQNLETFDNYESWLKDQRRFSRPGKTLSNSFLFHVGSIVASEVEKFLLEFDVPQTYGFLLEIDPSTYKVDFHRLYKVPFCPTCNASFEYRRAPWLEPVTLGGNA